MTPAFVQRIAFAASCFIFALPLAAQTSKPIQPSASDLSHLPKAVQANYGHLPLSFERNVGQTAPSVQWMARGPESTLFLSGNDATIEFNHIEKVKHNGVETPRMRGASLRMSLLQSQPAEARVGEDLQSGKANYFIGKDSSQWHTNVALYGQVRLNAVYPGVDLLYHGERGQLEYDFVVAPDADPTKISLGFTGAKPALAKNGDLLLPVPGEDTVRFDKPVVYQMKDGVRTMVDSSYQIASNGSVGFTLGQYDRTRELVIDPTLIYTGTFGTANQMDTPAGMTVDAQGEIIITGLTRDFDFPATTGAYQTTCGPMSTIATQNSVVRCSTGNPGTLSSAYVMKLSADGTHLIYATYLHGLTGGENGNAVKADASGNAVVIGQTSSDDFPLVNAPSLPQMSICRPNYHLVNGKEVIQETCSGYFAGGGTEFAVGVPGGFVTKLSADGSTLLYSAYIGFAGETIPESLALDATGNIYMLNQVLNADTALYGTTQPEVLYPTTAGALQGAGVGDYETALTVLSADGQTMLYSTIFGETQPISSGCASCLDGTIPSSIAVGQNGTVFIAGETRAATLPITANAAQPTCLTQSATQCYDNLGWLASFTINTTSGGGSLNWATYISGPNNPNTAVSTQLNSIAADAQNNVYMTGYTEDALFPITPGAYVSTCPPDTRSGANFCDPSVFVSKLNSAGAYVWSTFLTATQGSSSSANGNGIALDSHGQVYVYGDSGNQILPAVNPLSQYPNDWYQPYPFLAVLNTAGSNVVFSSQVAPNNFVSSMINGLALDSTGNVYMVGNTQGKQSYQVGNTTLTAWPTTAGTYSTPFTGTGTVPFFVKVSPILPVGVTTLAITPTTTSTGQPVTFNASVATITGTAAPTGTVAVSYTTAANSTPMALKTLTLGAGGTASYSTNSLVAGTYTFTAVYSGDSNYDVGTSSTVTVTINTPVTSALNLTTSAATVTTGASVIFTASVSGSKGTPTGTVTFLNGTTTLGTATLNSSGVATYTTSFAKAGSFTITASYGGDTNYGTSVSANVTEVVSLPAPAVKLTSSASPAASGSSVTFTASLTGSGTVAPTGTVTFLDGTTTLGTGTISNGVATYTTSSLAIGAHTITASYGGDTNYATAVSSSLTETIVAISFSVTYNPSSLTISRGSTGTTTISVLPNLPYTGTITLGCNGSTLSITCGFTPTSLTWNNSASAQTSSISIQTTAPHASIKTAGLWAGTWLGNLAASFALLLLLRKKKLRLAGKRLVLLALILTSTCVVAGISGCGGSSTSSTTTTGATIGGTPTGAQSLSITFNGNDNGTPVSITVQ